MRNLTILRQNAGMSITELSKRLGITPRDVFMLEEGGQESISHELLLNLNRPDSEGLTKPQRIFGKEWRLDYLLLEAQDDIPTVPAPPEMNPYLVQAPEPPSDQMKLALLAVQMRALCELMIEILGVDKPSETRVNCGQQ